MAKGASDADAKKTIDDIYQAGASNLTGSRATRRRELRTRGTQSGS